MQLIVFNENTGKEVYYRIDKVKDLYDLGLKYPRLKQIILRHSEDSDFLQRILSYFNKTSYLRASFIQDNPMLKAELVPVSPEEFKTRLDVWQKQRAAKHNQVSDPDIADPGRRIPKEKDIAHSNTVMGKLAEKFAKWRGK